MGEYLLSLRQKEIATAPYNLPSIILAPPGTGKTHTIIARIIHLVVNEGLAPHEILVLSFTRIAVKEISDRIGKLVEDESLHDDLRFVSLSTFDSFATRLMISADPDVDISDVSYNSRIELAIKRISNPDSTESSMVKRIRHLIVDEIQDLVGFRAELVRVLLKKINGGFSLFGDPAQAIYGWSIQDGEIDINIDVLLSWIRDQSWLPELSESDLEVDYRSGGEIARNTSHIREMLFSADPEDEDSFSRMNEIINGLDSAGSPRTPGAPLQGGHDASVCILCRTNGELLQVAYRLSSNGLNYRLRPRSDDYALPALIGRVLGDFDKNRISKQVFLEEWHKKIPEVYPVDKSLAWRWLTRITSDTGNSLNLSSLRNELFRGRRLPDEADALLDVGSNGLMISTIHASKGREFDNVVILDSKNNTRENGNQLEEARVLYVAATRSRGDLFRLDRAGIPFLYPFTGRGGRKRWVSTGNGCYFLEVGLNGDFNSCSPVSKHLFMNRSQVKETQNYLWGSVKSGDEILIVQKKKGKYRFYEVYHGHSDHTDGKLIGQLSLNFFRDVVGALKKISKGQRFSYPMRMNLKVASITTEVLPPYAEDVYIPYDTSRFCVGLRVKGMGYLWKK